MLWQRRDAMPDPYPTAGGITTPVAEGVVSISIEAWDGDQWEENWDSDYDGLPHALRISLAASGHLPGDPVWDAPLAHLRTIVPLERVPPPDDVMEYELQEQLAILNGEEPGASGDGPGSVSNAAQNGGQQGSQGGGQNSGGQGGGSQGGPTRSNSGFSNLEQQ